MEAIQEHIQQLESQAKSIRGKAALLESKKDKRAKKSLYKLADQTTRAEGAERCMKYGCIRILAAFEFWCFI